MRYTTIDKNMTYQAKRICDYMNYGLDAEQMLAKDAGSSTAEIEFIIEQIKIAHGE